MTIELVSSYQSVILYLHLTSGGGDISRVRSLAPRTAPGIELDTLELW